MTSRSLMRIPVEDWERSNLAACRNHPDPGLWFPERGHETDQAKAICHACPVRRDCLDFALRNRIQYGVWGGRSARQRDRIYRRWRAEQQVGA